MNELTKRQIEIIKILQKKAIVTSKEIAQTLNISTKTVQKEIKELNIQLNYPCILSVKGSGYQLKENFDLSQIQQDPTNRHFLILRKLLSENTIDFYDLADSLFISESTLSKEITEINQIIQYRNPNIKVFRKYNQVILSGSETARRQVSAYFLLHELNDYDLDLKNYESFFTEFSLCKLKEYILRFNKEHQIIMKDLETLSFVIHVAIMLDRILKGNMIPSVQILSTDAYFDKLAILFEQGLKNIIEIDFSQDESNYLSCLFAGKMSTIQDKDAKSIHEFILQLLQRIKEQYEIDLTQDEGLINNLHLHIMSLKNRLDNKTFLNNPLIEDIKIHFPLMYDISVFMALNIQNYFGKKLKESEIGYLTLHLMGAIERMQTSMTPCKVVVINPIGESMNGYIRRQLSSIHEINIEVCAIVSMFDLEEIDQYAPDFLISMVPINSSIPYPTYICEGLFTKQDKNAILNELKKIKEKEDISKFFEPDLYFYQQDLHKKEDVIYFLCKKLEQKGYVNDSYIDLVMKREEIAPTAYGGMIAVPHPIEKKAKVNKIAVCVLKDAILWNEHKVRIIFLFSLSKQKDPLFDHLFENLVSLIDNIQKVKKLCKAKTLDEFLLFFKNK